MTSGNNILIRFARAIVLYMVLISLSSFAGNEVNLNELMQGFAQIKSSQAKFTEKKYLRILNKPLESSGTLSYKAPDHLEKRTLLPRLESIVLEQNQITVENKAKNFNRTFGLQDYPLIGAFVESIRSTLAGDSNTLKKFYVIKLGGTMSDWRLLLQPINQNMKAVISEIRINGGKNKISTIEVIETEGDRSVMKITEASE